MNHPLSPQVAGVRADLRLERPGQGQTEPNNDPVFRRKTAVDTWEYAKPTFRSGSPHLSAVLVPVRPRSGSNDWWQSEKVAIKLDAVG